MRRSRKREQATAREILLAFVGMIVVVMGGRYLTTPSQSAATGPNFTPGWIDPRFPSEVGATATSRNARLVTPNDRSEWRSGPPLQPSPGALPVAGTNVFTSGTAGKRRRIATATPVSTVMPKETRSVCCRRGEGAPYWTTNEWCRGVGATVDDQQCAVSNDNVCCEYRRDPSTGESQTAWVTSEECHEHRGKKRNNDACHPAGAVVCCDQSGHVSMRMRADCEGSHVREVDVRMCQPVCCDHPEAGVRGWGSRGNCGNVSDPTSRIVSAGECDEICCESADGSRKRGDRRSCARKNGTVRSLVDCGGAVALEAPRFEDPMGLQQAAFNPHVDVDVRPPAASPFQ